MASGSVLFQFSGNGVQGQGGKEMWKKKSKRRREIHQIVGRSLIRGQPKINEAKGGERENFCPVVIFHPKHPSRASVISNFDKRMKRCRGRGGTVGFRVEESAFFLWTRGKKVVMEMEQFG